MLLQSVEVSARHCVSAAGKHLAPTSVFKIGKDGLIISWEEKKHGKAGGKRDSTITFYNLLLERVKPDIEKNLYDMSPKDIAKKCNISNQQFVTIWNILYKTSLNLYFLRDQKNQLSAAVVKQLRAEDPTFLNEKVRVFDKNLATLLKKTPWQIKQIRERIELIWEFHGYESVEKTITRMESPRPSRSTYNLLLKTVFSPKWTLEEKSQLIRLSVNGLTPEEIRTISEKFKKTPQSVREQLKELALLQWWPGTLEELAKFLGWNIGWIIRLKKALKITKQDKELKDLQQGLLKELLNRFEQASKPMIQNSESFSTVQNDFQEWIDQQQIPPLVIAWFQEHLTKIIKNNELRIELKELADRKDLTNKEKAKQMGMTVKEFVKLLNKMGIPFAEDASNLLGTWVFSSERKKLAEDLNAAKNKKEGFTTYFFMKSANVDFVSNAFSMKGRVSRRMHDALRRVLDEEIPQIPTPQDIKDAIASAKKLGITLTIIAQKLGQNRIKMRAVNSASPEKRKKIFETIEQFKLALVQFHQQIQKTQEESLNITAISQKANLDKPTISDILSLEEQDKVITLKTWATIFAFLKMPGFPELSVVERDVDSMMEESKFGNDGIAIAG